MTATTSLALVQSRPVKESNQSSPRLPMRELTLDELLASPLVRRMMERDGVNARALRALIVSIACRRSGEQEAAPMSYFDPPPGERVLREFTIWQDPSRGWVVAETPSLASNVFGSREEAERFALREAEGDLNRVIFDGKGA